MPLHQFESHPAPPAGQSVACYHFTHDNCDVCADDRTSEVGRWRINLAHRIWRITSGAREDQFLVVTEGGCPVLAGPTRSARDGWTWRRVCQVACSTVF